MAEVFRTEPAQRDLLEIWVHIAENSLEAADRFLSTVNATCHTIADTPGIGRKREEFGKGLRSFPLGSYLLFYRPIKGGIEVVRVLHGARNIQNLFPQGDENS